MLMTMLRGVRIDRHAAYRIDDVPGQSVIVMCSLGHDAPG